MACVGTAVGPFQPVSAIVSVARPGGMADYCGKSGRTGETAMKLGLLADIHERNGHLRAALCRFRLEQVDQVVVLGDVAATGSHLAETCRLLREARAVGVW